MADRFPTVLDYAAAESVNWTSNYGNSNFDVRQRLSASYIYELPFGRGKALAQPAGSCARCSGRVAAFRA